MSMASSHVKAALENIADGKHRLAFPFSPPGLFNERHRKDSLPFFIFHLLRLLKPYSHPFLRLAPDSLKAPSRVFHSYSLIMHVSLIILSIFGLRAIAMLLPSWKNSMVATPITIWKGSVTNDLTPIAPAMGASPAISLGEMARWLPALEKFRM